MIRTNDTIFWSLLYCSALVYIRLKYVISNLSKDGFTTSQFQKSGIDPFVANQSAVCPSLGGDNNSVVGRALKLDSLLENAEREGR